MARIRVGIVGYEPDRSWAAVAHVPALRALSDAYEVVAVATTRRESAEASARSIGIDLAFDNAEALANHLSVDVVLVAAKVPTHKAIIEAAIAAGKHVYCEWPLGNGLAEAEYLADLARKGRGRCVVGMQARLSPPVDQARQMIADGYVGEVLSTTLIGSGMQWGDWVDKPNAYIVDKSNGATLLTIPAGHTLDALCHTLGEFSELAATTAIRQPNVLRTDTGETLIKTAEDQIVVGGTLTSGTIAAVHYRGGAARGTRLLWEINGSEGDLQLTAEGGHAQIFDLSLFGARGEARSLEPLAITAQHRWVPTSLTGPAVNVAQVWARFADDMRTGGRTAPDFDDAVTRHRLVAAIEQSAADGRRATLG